MFLKIKNRNTKGNLIAQFVVLLVVAVILILFVTSFGAKIWASFFPNSDKSTLSSFEMMYQVINAKILSQKTYDSMSINIYMKENYRILLFNEPLNLNGDTFGTASCWDNAVTFYSPKVCETSQCICLYNKMPVDGKENKEKNVVKCHKFINNTNFDVNYFDINNRVCNSVKTSRNPNKENADTTYKSFMVIRRTTYEYPPKLQTPNTINTLVPKAYVYIIEDNESNRALEKEWSIPRCDIDKTGDALKELCNGQIDGTVIGPSGKIKPNDEILLKTIYDNCKKNTPSTISTSITCKFTNNVETHECFASCNDISSICTTNAITSNNDKCDIYNQINGIYDIKYITSNYNHQYSYMCVNDANYCNVASTSSMCQPKPLQVYTYMANSKGTYTPKTTTTGNGQEDIIQGKIQKCITDKFAIGNNEILVKSYDTTDADCNNIFKANFNDARTVYTCNPDNIQKCEQSIKDNIIKCAFKTISQSGKTWITSYNDDQTCTELKDTNIFLEVDLCTSI